MEYTRRLFSFFKSPAFWVLTLLGNGFFLCAVTVVYFLERNINPHMKTFFDAIWWGATTITTVGYGDIVPQSIAARVIGLILMYTGTVLFISFTSLIAAHFIRIEVTQEISPLEKEVEEEVIETGRIEKILGEINRRLERLEKK